MERIAKEFFPKLKIPSDQTFNTNKEPHLKAIIKSFICTIAEYCKSSVHSFIEEREHPENRNHIKNKLKNLEKELNSSHKNLTKWYPQFSKRITELMNWLTLVNKEIEEVMLERSLRPINVNFDKTAVVNLTTIYIPEDIGLVLSFGPKFCFPPTTSILSTAHFLTHTAVSMIDMFPVETHFELYKQISIGMNRERKGNLLYRHIWLDFLHFRINKFIKIHEDILITRSDKGKHTIIIKEALYIQKMDDMIISTTDYIKIDDINIDALEEKNNKLVDELTKQGIFNKIEPQSSGNEFKEQCSFPARMYGLIKIHKKDYPLRPITSACSAVGYKLATLFTKILDKVFPENGFHVKNSLELKTKIEDTNIQTHEIMLSFDVVSMFTSILIEIVIEILKERSKEIYETFNIPFPLFEKILKFILKECAVFKWQGNWYRQKDSLAMGSPLSPILAKILMNKIINVTLSKLHTPPKVLALYVDDSFWVIDEKEANHTLNILNSFHPSIKFTCEKEQENKINFLDLTIIRSNSNTLITDWYRKPFASSRILNFYSHHEETCITQTAIAFVKMVLNLSHPSFFLKNKPVVESILRLNSFPETDIIGIIHSHYTYFTAPIQRNKFEGTYIPIKFRTNLTNFLKKQLTPFLTNERLVGIPDRSNSKIFSPLKDKIILENRINVVFLLSCQCQSFLKMTYPKYGTRSKECLDQLFMGIDTSDGKCSPDNLHKFNKLKQIQCKNFSYTRTLFDMLAFANKDKLIQTNFNPPIFRFGKHLIYAKEIEESIINNI